MLYSIIECRGKCSQMTEYVIFLIGISATIFSLWSTVPQISKSLKSKKTEEKKGFTIGRAATPTISSILTGSDDIQIDSVTLTAKLGKDIIKKKKDQ